MKEFTAHQLREMIALEIATEIATHRLERKKFDPQEYYLHSEPTDEEINDFIISNPNFDSDLAEQLTDPGLLGFHFRTARVTEDWLISFRNDVSVWAKSDTWIKAELPWLTMVEEPIPDEREIWIPQDSMRPLWVSTSKACVAIAADLLNSGRLLSEMDWRSFEKLIGDLLEADGWAVVVTRPSKDGGVDVVATRDDDAVGTIRTVWQAKKYGPSNKVKLREVRELYAIREEQKASKALIVTTSHLTREAVEWIRRDTYRLGYKEQSDVERWIRRIFV